MATPLGAEDSSSILTNRELIAKEYEIKPDTLTLIKLSLRKAAAPMGALGLEVLSATKSGAELVIDRISGDDPTALQIVSDRTGAPVGFIRSWSTDDSSHNATTRRSAISYYIVVLNGLIAKSNEIACVSSANNKAPNIQLSNTLIDVHEQEISFDVRSNCHFPKLNGNWFLHLHVLGTKIPLDNETVEVGERFAVGLNADGNVTSVDKIGGNDSFYGKNKRMKRLAACASVTT